MEENTRKDAVEHVLELKCVIKMRSNVVRLSYILKVLPWDWKVKVPITNYEIEINLQPKPWLIQHCLQCTNLDLKLNIHTTDAVCNELCDTIPPPDGWCVLLISTASAIWIFVILMLYHSWAFIRNTTETSLSNKHSCHFQFNLIYASSSCYRILAFWACS